MFEFNLHTTLLVASWIAGVVIYLVFGMFALIAIEKKSPRAMQRTLDECLFWLLAAWAFWPPVVLFVLLYWLIKRPQPYQPPHYMNLK